MAFVKDSDVQFITQNDVMWIINFKISQLHRTTGFDPDQCLILLLKFGFDRKYIVENYNQNKHFLVVNGILPSENRQEKPKKCGVCCSDDQLIKLDCGHSACRNCWEFYLIGNIEDGNCLIECIEAGCYLLIGKSFISQFLDDVANYESLIINTFVKTNNTITKCPDDSCKLFAKTNTTEPQTVTCTCGRTFCSLCGQDPHLPATCRQMQLWNKKCDLLAPQIDDSSQQWLLEYTKECPTCLMTVEKKGGCAHITCPNKKCRHEFCWLCREDWKTHGEYPCDSPQRDAENARLDARADLSNFITHYNRFEHYQKFYKNKPRLINDAFESSNPFLQKIIHSYVNAREVLINSVVFGFFLRKGEYSDELKKFQHELERSTDRLKNSLIYTLSGPNFKKGKSELVNKCHDIEKCQKELLEFCANGKEFEDLNGQSYRDAWKKAHDDRVGFDDFTSGLTVLAFIVFAIYLAHFLNLLLPNFESWLPDFIVVCGKTIGINLRDDLWQRYLRSCTFFLFAYSVACFLTSLR
ncbi:unnamed protein product [Caenorhabditis brenneri]